MEAMYEQGDFNLMEKEAVLWTVGEDMNRPFEEVLQKYQNEKTLSIARSPSEIQKKIEEVEEHRERLYDQNVAVGGDQLIHTQTVYRWVLGESDDYDTLL